MFRASLYPVSHSACNRFTSVFCSRFRDFSELNSQVKQNFKGHHLREALPPLPEKPLKSLTDHKDPQVQHDMAIFHEGIDHTKLVTMVFALLPLTIYGVLPALC